MMSTKEHANNWPRTEPMSRERRERPGVHINAHWAESLRFDFGFPEDCDMVGLFA